jgi:hypothetical protein
MAYKFQRGTAILSGALLQSSNITVSQNAASGSLISVDGNGQGVEAGDDIIINNGNFLIDGTATHGADLYAGAAQEAQITGSTGKHVQLRIKNQAGNTILKMGSAIDEGEVSQGFLQQNASGGSTLAHLSGSGTGLVDSLSVGGQTDIAGLVTVTGNLTVNGTTTQIDTTNLRIQDDIAHIAKDASDLAGSKDSGFKVGTLANNSGHVLLKDSSDDSDVGGTVYFGMFGDSNNTADYINLEANKFYGDGSGVTGLSLAATHTVRTAKTNSDDLQTGVNFVTATPANTALGLPANGDFNIGDIIMVKSYGNHASDKKITITTANAADKIDGQDSVVLESAFASITIIKVSNTPADAFIII